MNRPEPGIATGLALWAALAFAATALSGCASLGYYWQSVSGHLELMRAARPVDEWLADPKAEALLKQRLLLARQLREFAVTQLQLPDGPSYRRYADIGRPYVVWNLVAAPELSLNPATWCFPVAGCVAYRGYFREADARAFAASQREAGLEVHIYGVPAYSTLGKLDWAGGDPLLSSFLNQGESDLARLLFHEMAHQVAYAKDDTRFNESFATAVERIGLRQWQAHRASEPTGAGIEVAQRLVLDALAETRRTEFRALAWEVRANLVKVYAALPTEPSSPTAPTRAGSPDGAVQGAEQAREAKRMAMQSMRQRYEQLRAQWLQSAAQAAPDSALAQPASLLGYDRWMQGANNAALAAMASYDAWVPAFERLFEREGRDWRRFHAAVRALAAMPKEQREAALRALL